MIRTRVKIVTTNFNKNKKSRGRRDFYIEMLIVIILKLSVCRNSPAERLPDNEIALYIAIIAITAFFR